MFWYNYIKFDLYFTAIPKNLDFIDLIEYNKAQDCEFDVYSVDIRQKKKTNPNKVQEIPVNLLTNERTTPHQESSKASVHKTAPIIDEPPAPPALDSTVSVKKDELALKMRIVDIEVCDNDKEDGDIISLKLNGNLILEHLELKKQPYKITVMLAKGENTLVMKAENLGTRGNNTAAIKINDSVLPPKTVILNSDMGHSEALRIVVK